MRSRCHDLGLSFVHFRISVCYYFLYVFIRTCFVCYLQSINLPDEAGEPSQRNVALFNVRIVQVFYIYLVPKCLPKNFSYFENGEGR